MSDIKECIHPGRQREGEKNTYMDYYIATHTKIILSLVIKMYVVRCALHGSLLDYCSCKN